MAPVVKELERRGIDHVVIVTAQHRGMLDQILDVFDIHPHHDLDIMQHDQDLFYVTSAVLNGIKPVLLKEKPDVLLVQGDTTTTFAVSLAAYYLKIPVGHVEAGLRTWDKMNPYPEELNRQLTTRLTEYHFAPTEWAKRNLAAEGIKPEHIFVTGNTVIDALLRTVDQDYRFDDAMLGSIDFKNRRVILLTSHRRENFGEPMKEIFSACQELGEKKPPRRADLPRPSESECPEGRAGNPVERSARPPDRTDGVPAVRPAYEQVVSHPYRLRRGPGRGSEPRQTGPRAPQDDRASRGDRRRDGKARRDGPEADRPDGPEAPLRSVRIPPDVDAVESLWRREGRTADRRYPPGQRRVTSSGGPQSHRFLHRAERERARARARSSRLTRADDLPGVQAYRRR